MIEMNINIVERNYEIAKEIYAEFGVDTDKVLKKLDQTCKDGNFLRRQ